MNGERCKGVGLNPISGAVGIDRTENAPASGDAPAAPNQIPKMYRMTVVVEARDDNHELMGKLADLVAPQLIMVRGYKLLKLTTEFVHGLESFGTLNPAPWKEPTNERKDSK